MENTSDAKIIADAIYKLSESVDELKDVVKAASYSNGGNIADNIFEVWQAIRKTPEPVSNPFKS